MFDAGFVADARLLSSSADSAASAGSSPDQAFSNVESRDRRTGFLGLRYEIVGVMRGVGRVRAGKKKSDKKADRADFKTARTGTGPVSVAEN